MNRHKHWEHVYRSRRPTEVSWYSPHLEDSLRLIRKVSTPVSSIIDVGGGSSTLVDDLLLAGYHQITVLDISETALAFVRSRLGERGKRVTWVQADVTSVTLPAATYDVWHDRAVFHFLTQESDREAYMGTLNRTLKKGGHVVIGAFSLSGPDKCSGLDVVKYDIAGLQRELGMEYSLTASEELMHVTPGGKQQPFVLCRFERLLRANIE